VITEAELLSGALDAKDEASIYAVLDVMVAIEVERGIAISAGTLRRKYYPGHKTALPDAILAATANTKLIDRMFKKDQPPASEPGDLSTKLDDWNYLCAS